MGENLPIVLIEGVLIFGGVLAFAWWQLHEIKVDQRKAAAERAEREAHESREAHAQPSVRPVTTEPLSPANPPAPADAP
jgi:predicted negative regulator of RcsB-dependent stress response